MAKKKAPQNKSKKQQLPENALPQNILPMGERVEENKNIYISQKVYKEIRKFTRNKTKNESGGVLVGTVIQEMGKTNIIISGFVEGKYCEATPTTLKFTHQTWEHIHKEVDKRFPGKKIMGWIHTHPDFGIFLSEYDKFIHENFFSEENQIAYVVDPIRHIEGFYFWINGKLERCKGFYIYEKNGARIDIDTEEETEGTPRRESAFSFRNILLGILTAAVVLMFFWNYSLNKQVESLKTAQTVYAQQVQQYINDLYQRVHELTLHIQQQHPAPMPEPTEPIEETTTEAGEQTEVNNDGQ